MIDGEDDGNFDKQQYVAYQALMKNWEILQPSLMQAILDYYNQKQQERSNDYTLNEGFPIVKTTDQVFEMIMIEGIVVPSNRKSVEFFIEAKCNKLN